MRKKGEKTESASGKYNNKKKDKEKKKPKNKGKELSHYSNFQLDAESNSRLLYTAMWLNQRPYATLSNNQMQS